MNILVSGSTAYDYIMDFKDSFENHIDPDKVHELSVSFLIDELRKEIGGTGLNIAYNLSLLGEKPVLLTSVGKDFIFSEYLLQNINLDYVIRSKELFTASGYITNDMAENQITAFYPGAMDEADKDLEKEIKEELAYGIVSPNKKEAMLKHLADLKGKNVKSFFDPGQALFVFNKEDLEKASSLANYLIVNDYEYGKFQEIIGWTDEQILDNFEKVIVTYGPEGSQINSKEEKIRINPVKVDTFVDPTGAGDSYRAGLLRGLQLGYNWRKAGKIGSLLASVSVQHFGGQNHKINKEEFRELFIKEYEEKLEL